MRETSCVARFSQPQRSDNDAAVRQNATGTIPGRKSGPARLISNMTWVCPRPFGKPVSTLLGRVLIFPGKAVATGAGPSQGIHFTPDPWAWGPCRLWRGRPHSPAPRAPPWVRPRRRGLQPRDPHAIQYNLDCEDHAPRRVDAGPLFKPQSDN